ncbi:MAG: DUF131 domain-containing protein [Nanoarchaeota archaeon]
MKSNKMSGTLLMIGIVLLFLGVILIIISSLLASQGKSKAEVGFGGFIGPIPFGYFTSSRMFWVWILFTIIFVIIWFILLRKL